MNNINKIYGKRLKELRLQKKFTQEYIANSIEVRTATISDFENGKISIKLDVLTSICSILGITIKEFFDFNSLPIAPTNQELITGINDNLKTLDIEKLKYVQIMTSMYNNKINI